MHVRGRGRPGFPKTIPAGMDMLVLILKGNRPVNLQKGKWQRWVKGPLDWALFPFLMLQMMLVKKVLPCLAQQQGTLLQLTDPWHSVKHNTQCLHSKQSLSVLNSSDCYTLLEETAYP